MLQQANSFAQGECYREDPPPIGLKLLFYRWGWLLSLNHKNIRLMKTRTHAAPHDKNFSWS